jgi:8-oxo-dGTP pyrophosphatase MutT (NUDIX family)
MSQRLIAKLHHENKYRPTSVAILYQERDDPSFLLVQSARTGHWGLLKGGIRPHEPLENAFYREILEEVGVSRRYIRDVKHGVIPHRLIKGQGRNIDNKGFREGKAYFLSAARCIPATTIVLDEEEIRDADWVKPDKIEKWLPEDRPRRNLLYLRALRSVVRKLRQDS